ncbi:homoserine kinase [soil metagenome]
MDEITVLAPATVSNVVCGFDCLGFALAEPYDRMTLRKIPERGIRIVTHDDFGLPTDPTKNVAGVALKAFIEKANPDYGFELEITKHIKPGSGIGSSAASSAGAVVAANLLMGSPFSKTELVELAMAGEMLASGSRHADNLAPCIYGGFVLVRSAEPLDIIELDFPPLFATVIHPQIEIKTSDARAMLPMQVPLKDAVRNWSNLGAFIAGLSKGDHDLIARSMVDRIIEPVRNSLIPQFNEVKAAGLAAGALGGGISGSGPSMFMLSRSREIADGVAADIRSVYVKTGLEFIIYVSQISADGVRPA